MAEADVRAHAVRYIDLHAHTNESDGTLSPSELIELAKRTDLAALAVTDHDTFAGFEKALPFAGEAGLDLVCGIELNTRLYSDDSEGHRYAHVLAYFPHNEVGTEFSEWLHSEREHRRSRNRQLAEALRGRGIDIALEEVEARGRTLAGRPHFARLLIEKGHVKNFEEAFRLYLGESAPTYVPRRSKTTEEVIRIVRRAGGAPVIAHPIRLGLAREAERAALLRFKEAGLMGLEIYHSEHPAELQAHYHQLAQKLDLIPTGGSDFHGSVKPNIRLGTGLNGNVRVPLDFLDTLRQATA